MRKFLAAFAVVLSISLLVATRANEARAQAWPTKPIKLVIPFGPGSASDAMARVLAQDLAQTLGQPVVVVGKPGADGALAGTEVQRSAPDGTTFLFGTNSPLSLVPTMRKEPPYNVLTDFTPISYIGDNTFFIAVHPSLPVKSIAELVAYAKANPGKLNYAAGNTFSLVGTAMIARSAGIEMQSIPYKSEPDAIADVLSGRVPLINGTYTTIGPQVSTGGLRLLATAFHARHPMLPDTPSIVEAGLPKQLIRAWFGIVGPAGLPPEIVERMNKAVVAALAKPAVREPMEKQGFVPGSSTPQELATIIKDQLAIWKAALKDAGIEPQ